ncbi:hypothetical protein VNO78_13133 [Psophocarpus tetragonolobus]|uniref:MADS-box domain-containing protein n=1 Tax=Psophocarpus tetragonolobus TaxID=3891 RepID=A0AAN9XPN7_PSOTE
MGRARIRLECISNERSRKTTLMQRKKGLIKKVSEFSIMCGVEACLIVYDDENGDVEPVTWPQESTMVRSIIQKHYEQQLKNERPPKNFGIEDFFENRKNMVEVEISKVHKQITDIKYPTWDQNMRSMEEEQLKAFIAHVDDKIRVCEHRINMLKSQHQSEVKNMVQTSAMSSHPSQIILHNNNNNRRVDFTNLIYQGDETFNLGVINTLVNMQQSDACYSFVPNMIQKSGNATSSHPSQVINCLPNISQSQPMLEALKSPNHGVINTLGMGNIQQENACFGYVPNMIQESANVTSSYPSQINCLQNISQSKPTLEAFKPLNDKNDVIDFTNQLGESTDYWANQVDYLNDWFDGPID